MPASLRKISPQRFILLSILFLSHPLFANEAGRVQELCPGKVEIHGTTNIKLNEIEKALVCGDSSIPAWSEIPPNQAKFHLGVFLQDRGFLRPTFQMQKEKLVVELGPQTLLSQVEVQANPPFTEIHRKRHILKKPLTPKRLDEVENWITREVQSTGYPCPKITTRANIVTGETDMDLDRGPKQKVVSVTQESVPGLDRGALRRYDAFQLDKPFNDDLLVLTSRRIEEDGVLQSSHFTWPCPSNPEGVDLFERAFPGKPRLFKIGFGFDTQEYGIIKSSWKHTRLGKNASNFEVKLYASYLTQDLEVSSDWYPFDPLNLWYLKPTFSFIHERQDDFHYAAIDNYFGFARRYDNQKIGLTYAFGPALNYTYTFSGANPGWTHFLTLYYQAEIQSHDWEYWQADPRSGFHLLGSGNFGAQDLFSSVSAQRFSIDWQYLYNFRNYDVPMIVIGIRGGIYGTYAHSDQNTFDILPPNYKFYLGGSQNLRGFSLNELPGEDGALSALWGGIEIRLAHTLPYWIEPLVFFDAGVLGDNAFSYQYPVYYSPGGGLRVASPIGVFRTTFATGFKAGGDDGNPGNTHFQFLFSFGEEF